MSSKCPRTPRLVFGGSQRGTNKPAPLFSVHLSRHSDHWQESLLRSLCRRATCAACFHTPDQKRRPKATSLNFTHTRGQETKRPKDQPRLSTALRKKMYIFLFGVPNRPNTFCPCLPLPCNRKDGHSYLHM